MILRFAHPWFLLLLLVVPLWLWVRVSTRFRTALHFPSLAKLKILPDSKARRFHPLLHVLATLALILLIMGLARPQSGLRQRTVTSETIDMVLAIDTSTSMNAIDFSEAEEKNRLEVVIEVAEDFIGAREADRIGLIAFAAMPYTKSPLTLDHAWLGDRLRELKTGELPDGTAIGSALASAVNRLRNSEAESKVVILLTDGISNTGDMDPLKAATLAEEVGVRVYTIGAGAEGPVRFPVQDMFGRSGYRQVEIPIDVEALTRIAETTGGRFFRARDTDELENVFSEIDELERTEIDLTEYTLYTEQFHWLVAGGLGLFLLERILAAGRLGRALS
ncbi:MAG: VWA domain-containing protein [Kiritimatiellae bacterium]|jgi:Ca-activated chloride channel family protein|nr:VWA domain-containing protein [Kiritimatiellia bacterium]